VFYGPGRKAIGRDGPTERVRWAADAHGQEWIHLIGEDMKERNGASKERSTTMCLTKRSVKHLQELVMVSFLILLAHGVKTEGAFADTYITEFGGGATGAYTFTFDDGTLNQWQYALPVLNEHNIHATFFLIGSSVEAWYSVVGGVHVPHVLNMAAAGHEIGSHTYNHLSLTDLNDVNVHAQMALNQSFFRRYGINIVSMAYPYSATNERIQAIVSQYIEFARDGEPITTNSSSWSELNPLDLKWSSRGDNHYECVDRAIASRTWAIGVFHQVGQVGVQGVPTAEEFSTFVKYVVTLRDAGVLWIDTVKNVASYIRERSIATVRPRYDAEANTIKVSLKVGLAYPYIVPLTLRTSIGDYFVESISQAEMPISYKLLDDQTGTLVQYDVVPDGGEVTIRLTDQSLKS